MSLASTLASIEADVISYLPTAVQLFSGVESAVSGTGNALTKAIGVASSVATVADTIPNEDVEAAGGLLGLITSLLAEFVPASTVAAAKQTQTANATASASSPLAQAKMVPETAVSPAPGSNVAANQASTKASHNVFDELFHHTAKPAPVAAPVASAAK